MGLPEVIELHAHGPVDVLKLLVRGLRFLAERERERGSIESIEASIEDRGCFGGVQRRFL